MCYLNCYNLWIMFRYWKQLVVSPTWIWIILFYLIFYQFSTKFAQLSLARHGWEIWLKLVFLTFGISQLTGYSFGICYAMRAKNIFGGNLKQNKRIMSWSCFGYFFWDEYIIEQNTKHKPKTLKKQKYMYVLVCIEWLHLTIDVVLQIIHF